MTLFLFNRHFAYLLSCCSPRPTVLTGYPRDQECQPRYRLFNTKCMTNILRALLPFRNPTNSATEYFGDTATTKWVCVVRTLPSSISTCFNSHSCVIISRTDLPTSPFKILNRYFRHHTIGYLQSPLPHATFLKSFIQYLLLMFRVTTFHPKELFSFVEANTYTHLNA
jgi:hypothetical protein